METISSIDPTAMSGTMRQLGSEEMTFVSGGRGFPPPHHGHSNGKTVECMSSGGELLSWTAGGAIAGAAGGVPGAILGGLGGFVGDFLSQISNGPCGNH